MKKVLAIVLAATMSMSLVACSGREKASGTETAKDTKTAEESTSGEIKPIEMQLCYWGAEVPSEDNSQVLKYVEDAIGVKINPTWVPPSAMTEKTTTTIIGGNIPEVLMIVNSELRTEIVDQAVSNGMFYDLTDEIPKYSNLDNLPKNILMGMNYDGKFYAIPRSTLARNGGVLMRQDWLEKLGMDSPINVAQYEEMFRAFTQDDPDGNGKDDTVGFSMYGLPYYAPLMLANNCAPSWWIDEETKQVLPSYLSPGYMDYLKFIKKMYDAGYTNSDFAATTQAQVIETFNTGKVGSYPDSMGKISGGNNFQALYDSIEGSRVLATCETEMPDGTLATDLKTGFYGTYFISSAVSEERLAEILTAFDKITSDEVVFILGQGAEGVHYNFVDGKFEWILDDDGLPLFNKQTASTGSLTVKNSFVSRTKLGVVDNSEAYYEFQTRTDLKEYPEVTSWFDANSDVTPVKDIVDTAATKFIMGDATEQDVLDAIDKWLAGGGQANIDDWTAQYAAMGK